MQVTDEGGMPNAHEVTMSLLLSETREKEHARQSTTLLADVTILPRCEILNADAAVVTKLH
jgi:hypothetical protein